ncbi:Sir2 histone deacetylase Hst2 [Lecanora helva]
MGQEQSCPIDEATPPQTLSERSVEAVAKYIKEGRAKKIVVMVGAGISTSAGIPDFRSPDTGLYANLARLNLPFAEAVFDISYFRGNPLPFYALAHELYPGKYQPTISHFFVRLLSDKGLLLKLFTQNIDCLDREAGVPDDQIVEAHGSFATHHCIECKSYFPDDLMKQFVSKAEVPHCLTPQCNGLVKPDIVFFGEALPQKFHESRSLPSSADLCIVMGTSLSVQPFASLPSFCSDGVPRVLINLERVGGLGSRTDDVLILGECDVGVRKLAAALGWEEELQALWNGSGPDRQDDNPDQRVTPKTKDETLNNQIASLSIEVDKSLKISKEHRSELKDHLAKDSQEPIESDPTTSTTTSVSDVQSHTKAADQKAKNLASQADSTLDEQSLVNFDSVSRVHDETQNTPKSKSLHINS